MTLTVDACPRSGRASSSLRTMARRAVRLRAILCHRLGWRRPRTESARSSSPERRARRPRSQRSSTVRERVFRPQAHVAHDGPLAGRASYRRITQRISADLAHSARRAWVRSGLNMMGQCTVLWTIVAVTVALVLARFGWTRSTTGRRRFTDVAWAGFLIGLLIGGQRVLRIRQLRNGASLHWRHREPGLRPRSDGPDGLAVSRERTRVVLRSLKR